MAGLRRCAKGGEARFDSDLEALAGAHELRNHSGFKPVPGTGRFDSRLYFPGAGPSAAATRKLSLRAQCKARGWNDFSTSGVPCRG